MPRAKFPLGQTVPRVSDSREGTRQYTRQYMEALLQTFLAGALTQCTRCKLPGCLFECVALSLSPSLALILRSRSLWWGKLGQLRHLQHG